MFLAPVNMRGDKPNDLFKKIRAFENVIGVLEDGKSFYRLLTFLKYDHITNTITFGSPYMNKILSTLQNANIIIPKEKTPYINPHYSFLIHGTIANEKNKIAIEIINVIITLLHQRGEIKPRKEQLSESEMEKIVTKSVKKAIREEFADEIIPTTFEKTEKKTITTLHKKISSIIDEIPLLTEALNSPTIDKKTNIEKPKTAQEKNKILNRAFSKAYILLREKTDVYKYFNDLTITEIIPTISIINQSIKITHTGTNKNYK